MKNALFFLLFLIPVMGISQDVIEKVNGTKINCKVLRIDETNVEYKIKNTDDEPLRSIRISSIARIIFGNGTVEEFSEEGAVDARTGKKKRDPILGSGFYFDGMMGATSGPRRYTEYVQVVDPVSGLSYPNYITKYRMETFVTNGMRIGNKWYFGKHEKRRFGIDVTWLRFSTLMSHGTGVEDIFIAPISLGFASVFKFKNNIGLEVNTYTGGSIFAVNSTSEILLGLNTKFRFGSLALGLDYGYSLPIAPDVYRPHSHLFSLTVGCKF